MAFRGICHTKGYKIMLRSGKNYNLRYETALFINLNNYTN